MFLIGNFRRIRVNQKRVAGWLLHRRKITVMMSHFQSMLVT